MGRLRSAEIARSEEPGFVDREVEPGRRYRYQVVLVREDGSEAPPSAPVEIQLNPRDLAAETP